jgi:hypothetical protein
MTQAVHLIPLLCPKCRGAVPAQPGEVAWVCDACGQAMLIDDTNGSRSIDAFFSAQIGQNALARPFWVARGSVRFTTRQTYRGDESRAMNEFWSVPRLFYVPAYDLPVNQVVQEGIRLMSNPVAMQSGPRARYQPVVVSPRDVKPLAEFLVMSIEAARKDALKLLDFTVQLEEAQLWFLP